jgi:dihydroorotate dehydrogenase
MPQYAVDVMGLRFQNPVGLAAGFDRDGRLVNHLESCGFGFVEIGTVSASRRPGGGSLVAAVKNLARVRSAGRGLRVGVNIGSSRDGFGTEALGEHIAAMRALWPFTDYLAINLTSPRSPARRRLELPPCAGFLAALGAERDALTRSSGLRVPLAVKLLLDHASQPLVEVLKAAQIAGIIGVSDSVDVLRTASAAFDPIPIISVGGIRSAPDVAARLAAGAMLVQIFRAFVGGSPFLPRRIVAGLQAGTELERAG